VHDPCTVAFDIRSPFVTRVSLTNGKGWSYRSSLITIWHVDPERDGSDDSCGWAHYRMTPAERAWCEKLADDEFEFWMGQHGRGAAGGMPWTAADVVFAAWRTIASRTGRGWEPLTAAELTRIYELASSPHDSIRSVVASCASKEGMQRLFLCVYRLYRTHRRPWWKHPRWHVWHWRVQLHPWQRFRRWLFDRCEKCGGKFVKESPCTYFWDPPPTRWFRSAPGLRHQRCMDPPTQVAGDNATLH
jgi:hypothetical protein